MSSFTLQLLIISTFGLMAQSAPVNDVTKRSTDKEIDQRKLEKCLYCTTQSLYHAQEDLEDTNFTLPSLPQFHVDNITETLCQSHDF